MSTTTDDQPETEELVLLDHRQLDRAIWDAHAVRKMILEDCMMGTYYSSVAEFEAEVDFIADILRNRRDEALSREPF